MLILPRQQTYVFKMNKRVLFCGIIVSVFVVLFYCVKNTIPFIITKNKNSRRKSRASQVALVVKNPPASAGDARDVGLIPGSKPWRRRGHPLQDACLENPTDRGAWGGCIHGVAKSQTRLK